MECFHSLGSCWRSIKDWKMIVRGKAMLLVVFLKKTGGSRSGPAAEFNLSLLIMRTISRGEMWMSEIVSFDSGGKRDGKGGRVPLSSVNTDWKYWLNRFALSVSDVSRLPWWSIKGAMPLELLSLALTNL